MPTIEEKKRTLALICEKVKLSEADKKELFDRFFKYAEDKVIATAIDTIGGLTKEIKEFDELLSSMLSPTMYEIFNRATRPLMVFSTDKTKLDYIKVYPNIIINCSNKELLTASITDPKPVLLVFMEQYEKDLNGSIPGADEKWKTQERITKRLEKSEDQTIARILTMIFTTEGPAKLRDLAEKLYIARKPIELIYADKPQDFLVMYGPTGPASCMQHSNMRGWEWLEKAEMTATSFYAHFPWTRGAYIMKGGKVVARTVLFCSPDEDPSDLGYPNFNKKRVKNWSYGYPYATNGEMMTEFTKALKSNGYKPIGEAAGTKGNHFVPPSNVPIKVPGVINGRDWGMPFPFFDNMDYRGSGFSVVFDSTTKEFTLVYKTPGNGTVAANNRNGYLLASDYIQRMCEHCGSKRANNGDWITTNDGHMYCGVGCATRNGYKKVFQGNGEMWCKIVDETAFVRSIAGDLFTNEEAARRQNFHVTMIEPGIFAEEGEPVTNDGHHWVKSADGLQYISPHHRVTANEERELIVKIPVSIFKEQKQVVLDTEAYMPAPELPY